jgi:hypothetical protein
MIVLQDPCIWPGVLYKEIETADSPLDYRSDTNFQIIPLQRKS